ncbi:MAG TPA: tryptophan--tRNA ligase [Candidatus Moranbacteria bacterium]|nr:tryptophan--tRNA ligase [Candidatus Moranbacteria bacterium]
MTKKRIFSGIQPSGNLHIGNYLGAIANWVKMQDEFESIFCVVDMHAITVPQDPEVLRQKTIEVAKIYLASGIDPQKSSLFIQSHVPEHAELCWILNTITQNGDLTKMTQFKSKAGIQFDLEDFEKSLTDLQNNPHPYFDDENTDTDINKVIKLSRDVAYETAREFIKKFIAKFNSSGVGLFDYPVLMAADIILYDTQTVPVGEDQLQHIELARDLAKRFNSKFGETFVVPEFFIKKEGMRIMGLDDPSKKMSKSASSEYNYIAFSDSEEIIRKKIRKAVTDSGSEIVYRDEKPALKNLINIYSLLADKKTSEIETMYAGKGYGDFKNDLAEIVVNFMKPMQERISGLSDEKVLEILREGAEKIRPIAKKKLDEVKEKIGFIV